MKKLLTLLGIFFLFILFPSTVLATPVGKFTYIEGRVDITSPGEAARPARLGDEVNVGDIIRTKSEAKAEVSFVDGNILRLAHSTRTEITEYLFDKERTSSILRLFRGKIENKVKKLFGRVFGLKKKDRFEVHTPTAVVGVRGTDFFTYYKQGISGSIFTEGEGYCYSVNQPEQVKDIIAGQAMVVVSPDIPPTIKPATGPEIEKHTKDTAPTKEEAGEEEKEKAEEGTSTEATVVEADADVLASESVESVVVEAVVEAEVVADVAVEVVVVDIPPEPTPPPPEDTASSQITTSSFSGDMSISMDPATDFGNSSVKGKFTTSPPPKTDKWTLGGTMSDGRYFEGYVGGVLGTYNGLMNALWVKNGGVGFMTGTLTGDYNAADLTFDASGPVKRTPILGNTDIAPSELADALSNPDIQVLFEDIGLPVIGSIEAGLPISSPGDSSETAIMGIETLDKTLLGVWAVTTDGGTYSGQDSYWEGTYGYIGDSYYLLGPITGTDDLMGHVGISGTPTYMDNEYLGEVSLEYRGTYDSSGSYVSVGGGTLNLDPLFLSGQAYGDLGYFDGTGLAADGYAYGLLGATASSYPNLTLMGEYDVSIADKPFLSGFSISGSSLDGDIFNGYMLGIWKDGAIDARVLALGIDANGMAGYRRADDVTGVYYPDIKMWEANASVNELETVETTSVSPAELGNLYSGWMGGDLAGTFATGGSIEGSEYDSDTLSIINPSTSQTHPWGIYGQVLTGSFLNPNMESSWSAMLGGEGDFGAYNLAYEDSNWSGEGNQAYWIADANSSWSNGEIYSSISGRFLSRLHLGTLTGELLGTYDDGNNTWQAVHFGTWKGEPLSFVSDMDYAELKSTSDLYYGRWESQSDSSYYYYEYNEDGSYGYTYHYTEQNDSYTYTEYFADGTTATYNSLDDFWSYGAWDPTDPTFLAGLATPDLDYNWSDSHDPYTFYWAGYLEGLLGGTEPLWTATSGSPASFTMMGRYYEDKRHSGWPNPIWYYNDLSSYNDGGAYHGFMGGIKLDDTLEGGLLALYIDPDGNAGILKSSLITGTFYPGIGMFEAYGELYPIELVDSEVDPDIGIQPANLLDNIVVNEWWFNGESHNGWFVDNSNNFVGEIITRSVYETEVHILNQEFGITQSLLGGNYVEASTYDRWLRAWDFWDGNVRKMGAHIGTQWSNDRIHAKGYGSWVNLDSAVTGVSGAELIGTFNPSNHTWKAVSNWAWVTTDKFMDLLDRPGGREKLEALNIPSIQIGKAKLSGSDDILTRVDMNDVTFFSYSTGGDPRIWATKDVRGTYDVTVLPQEINSHSVILSGDGGFRATFEVNKWDTYKWGANIIDGSGTLTRTDGVGGTVDIEFKGGAAGTYNAGDFSGTGAGVANRQ